MCFFLFGDLSDKKKQKKIKKQQTNKRTKAKDNIEKIGQSYARRKKCKREDLEKKLIQTNTDISSLQDIRPSFVIEAASEVSIKNNTH